MKEFLNNNQFNIKSLVVKSIDSSGYIEIFYNVTKQDIKVNRSENNARQLKGFKIA